LERFNDVKPHGGEKEAGDPTLGGAAGKVGKKHEKDIQRSKANQGG